MVSPNPSRTRWGDPNAILVGRDRRTAAHSVYWTARVVRRYGRVGPARRISTAITAFHATKVCRFNSPVISQLVHSSWHRRPGRWQLHAGSGHLLVFRLAAYVRQLRLLPTAAPPGRSQ